MMGYREMAKAARDGKVGRLLTVRFHKWEKPDDEIVGVFVATSDVPSKDNKGTYKQYLFQCDDEPVKFSMGAQADKDILPLMVPGQIYSIRYLGKVALPGGHHANRFDVMELPADILADPVTEE